MPTMATPRRLSAAYVGRGQSWQDLMVQTSMANGIPWAKWFPVQGLMAEMDGGTFDAAVLRSRRSSVRMHRVP